MYLCGSCGVVFLASLCELQCSFPSITVGIAIKFSERFHEGYSVVLSVSLRGLQCSSMGISLGTAV